MAADPSNAPSNTPDARSASANETSTLGGGCFWCLEAVFAGIPGVASVEPGYAGGLLAGPTYEQVTTGKTGHAEVVRVTFDPAMVSFADLLEVFWKVHDPTTPNRQGADVGPQYRSIILYENAAQEEIAQRSKAGAQKNFRDPIVTEIVSLTAFYPAETYHRDFYQRNRDYPYCVHVIEPKLRKLGIEA